MRVMLARPRTMQWLDLDVRADAVQYTATLSGPGAVELALPLRYASAVGPDGWPVLIEYGTSVVVVDDNRTPVAYGLVDKVLPGEQSVKVSAGGVSMVSVDEPWEGPDRAWFNYDVLSGWRHIWAHVRDKPGTPALVIQGDQTCGVLVGRPESQRYRDVRVRIEAAERLKARAEADEVAAERMMVKAARSLYAVANKKKVGRIGSRTSAPSGEGEADECVLHIDNTTRGNVVQAYFWARVRPGTMGWASFSQTQARNRGDTYRDWEKRRDQAKDRAQDQQDIISPLETYVRDHLPESHPEPYTLTWHDSRDLSSNLSELRELGGFDWIETARWEDGKVRPVIEVRERVGARRRNVIFELGTNVHEEPSRIVRPYFSEVHVFGAGEGSDTLRADEARMDPVRVRRVQHVTDKDAKSQQLVNVALKREQRALGARGLVAEELVVTDSDWARFGTFGLGDEVRLRGRYSDGSRVNGWVRVLEMTHEGGNEMTVKVEQA